jgi:hypothetical protein
MKTGSLLQKINQRILAGERVTTTFYEQRIESLSYQTHTKVKSALERICQRKINELAPRLRKSFSSFAPE